MNELDLFVAALALADPKERAAYLECECQGNPALRQRIEQLLAGNEQSRNPLDQPPSAVAAAKLPAAGEATVDSVVGRPGTEDFGDPTVCAGVVIAGKYTLVEVIGEGGMGSVWRAKQTEPVKRFVAVKLIKVGMDSKQVLARFEAERQALALMDHPNIAKVFDAGLAEAHGQPSVGVGRPFFVMELVKGTPITDYCDANKLTPPQRLELFVQACQAIQHAHQKGIIHRDIKPSNVLVALYDDKPVVKVIDFGVAKATGGALTEATIDTRFGGVVGTPEYMSPEQASLNNLDIDTRSDVYSLGVLLFELLTGSTPVDRKSLGKAALLEILRIVREVEAPRPSAKLSTIDTLPSVAANRGTEPAKLSKLLKGELDWVLLKALEKDRSRRYETANALSRDIQRYLADEVVEARPPSTGYRLKKFVRRHKGQVVAASLIFLALVGGIVGTGIGLVQAEKARKAEADRAEGERLAKVEAQAARDNEARERGYAEAIAKFVKDDFLTLTSVEGQREHDGEGLTRDATLRDLLNRAAKKLGERKDLDPRTEAELNWIVGVSYRATGDASLAIPFLERSVELRRHALGRDDPDTLEAQNSLAVAYGSAGYYDKAQLLYEQTVELRQRRLGPDHKDTLASAHNLAMFYLRAWKEDLALSLIQDALARRKAILGPDHKDTLASMGVLAQALGSKGNYKLAVTTMEDALQLAQAKYSPQALPLLKVKGDLAAALAHAGMTGRALSLYKEVFECNRATYEPGHSATLAAMNNLAGAYESAGKLNEAVALFEEVYKVRTDKYGPTHPSTLISMSNLGKALVAADQFDRGLELLKDTSQFHLARFGPNHPDTFTSRNNLGYAYLGIAAHDRSSAAEYSEKALLLFEELIKLMKVRLGPSHPDTIQCMANLVMAYRQAGKKEEAVTLAEETARLMKTAVGPDHPRTLTAMNNLALTYADSRKVEKALALLKETLKLTQAKHGNDHPDTLKHMLNLAMAHQDAREHDKALPLFEETYKRLRASLGIGHSVTRRSLHYLAESRVRARQFDSAVPLLEELVALETAAFGPDHPATMSSMRNLGVSYWNLKKYDKSVPVFEELFKNHTAKYGKEHFETLDTAANLGVNYKDAGRLKEAIVLFEEVQRGSKKYPALRSFGRQLLDAYTKAGENAKIANLLLDELPQARLQLPADSPQLAGLVAQIGMGLMDQKRWTEADPLLRECLAIREKTQPDHWTTFNTQSMLGGVLLSQKKYADAEPLLLKGYEGLKKREKSIPPQGATRVPDALDRLIELYTATNKPDEVKKYKELRAKYPAAKEVAPQPKKEK